VTTATTIARTNVCRLIVSLQSLGEVGEKKQATLTPRKVKGQDNAALCGKGPCPFE